MVVHPVICEELLHLLIRPQFPCHLPGDVPFSVSNCTKCFSLSCQPQNLPPSPFLSHSLHNGLLGSAFLLTTCLNLFTLIPTATLMEHVTPCVPRDHIFSPFYSSPPHTLSALRYLFLPPPPPASKLPLFSTDRWLIQSQAMLFMKRHFIFQNHPCLRRRTGSITFHQSEQCGSVFESKPKFAIEYMLVHNNTHPHKLAGTFST